MDIAHWLLIFFQKKKKKKLRIDEWKISTRETVREGEHPLSVSHSQWSRVQFAAVIINGASSWQQQQQQQRTRIQAILAISFKHIHTHTHRSTPTHQRFRYFPARAPPYTGVLYHRRQLFRSPFLFFFFLTRSFVLYSLWWNNNNNKQHY